MESWNTSSQKRPRRITKSSSLLLKGCDSPCSPELFSSASRAWWFCAVVAHRGFSWRNSFLSLTQRPDSKIVLKSTERAVVCPWCEMGAFGERFHGIYVFSWNPRGWKRFTHGRQSQLPGGRKEGQLLSEEKIVLSLRVPRRMFTKRSLRERGWRDSNKSGEQLPLAEIREARRP